MTSEPFPWQRAMAFGLGTLRLAPDEFWRMTPRELAAAIEGVSGRGPSLTRTDFLQLMTRYPDGRVR